MPPLFHIDVYEPKIKEKRNQSKGLRPLEAVLRTSVLGRLLKSRQRAGALCTPLLFFSPVNA